MAITTSEAAFEPKAVATGPVQLQLVELVINSGATSGTVTAARLKDIYHIIVPGIQKHTAAPTYATNVATLAFTVPAETAAAQTIDGILYTAVADLGVAGNSITIRIVDGGAPASTPTVTVSETAITITADATAITGTPRSAVKTAVLASAPASALVIPSTVTSGTTVVTVTSATPLIGGVSGGFRGTAICIGR